MTARPEDVIREALLHLASEAPHVDDGYCVACHVSTATESLAALVDERNRLREALVFYADNMNWTQLASWGGRIHDDESAAIRDGGKRAAAALAASPGDKTEASGPDEQEDA